MFMQFRGTLDWQCPVCLTLNRSSVFPLGYRLKCVNGNCTHLWIWGGVLYGSGGTRYPAQPPDLIPLDGGVWRNGKIHKVFCDGCSAVIAEHAPPPVVRWPSKRKRLRDADGFAKQLPIEGEDDDGLPEDS